MTGRAATATRLSYVIGLHPSLTTTFIDREIEGLRDLGAEIVVVSLRRPTGLLSDAQRRSVDAVRYLRPFRIGEVVRAHAWAVTGRPRALLRVATELLREPHDGASRRATAAHVSQGVLVAWRLRDRARIHVHAHFADRAAIAGLVAARLLGTTYSLTAHANDIYLRPVLLDVKIRNATVAVTCTDHNRAHLESVLSPAAAARVRRIHHGLPLARLTPGRARDLPPIVIAAVAQLKEKKGLGDLLVACGLLRDRGVPFRCEIAGDGPLRAALTDQVRALHLEEQVRLLGAIPSEEVVALLGRSSLFVLPCVVAADGDRDGIPNAILEAMAMGLPVISTPISGIPEVVRPGETGVLVPPGDPPALADAIADLGTDLERRCRYGEAGMALVRGAFDIARNAQRLHQAFLGRPEEVEA